MQIFCLSAILEIIISFMAECHCSVIISPTQYQCGPGFVSRTEGWLLYLKYFVDILG
jgi:hypothetical protein